MNFETYIWDCAWQYNRTLGGSYEAYYRYLSKNYPTEEIEKLINSIKDECHKKEMLKLFKEAV